MKKRNLILSLTILVCVLFIHSVRAVEVNSTNFPDAQLRECIETTINNNSNISTVEEITTLSCPNKSQLSNVTGINYLTNLTFLNLNATGVKNLNLASNSKLITLYASHNSLESVTLPTTCNITTLNLGQDYDNDVTNASLKSLNVSNCGELSYAVLNGLTGLTTLDLTNNTKIRDLRIMMTNISTLKLPNSTTLRNLWAHNTKLTHLDLSKYTNLKNIYINNNNFGITGYLYVGDSVNFNDPSGIVTLPSEYSSTLATSWAQEFPSEPTGIHTYNTAGVFNYTLEYSHNVTNVYPDGQSASAADYYSGHADPSWANPSTAATDLFSVTYNVHVLEISSSNYIFYDRDYIYVGNDDDATVLANVSVNEGYLKIEGDVLKVYADSEYKVLIHELDIIRIDTGSLKDEYNGSMSYSDLVGYITISDNARYTITIDDGDEITSGNVEGWPLEINVYHGDEYVVTLSLSKDGSTNTTGTTGSSTGRTDTVTNPKTGIVYPVAMILVLGGVAAGAVVITKKTKNRKLIK